jgi:serine/threonine-protein kinase
MLFGKIALKNKLLTETQLEEALELQKEARKIGLQENLGTVCIRLGYLTHQDIEKILEVQLKIELKDASKLYGKIAMENGLLNQKQLDEGMALQEENKFRTPLGQYLLKLGYISMKDHQSVLEAIDRIQKTKGSDEDMSAKSISARLAANKDQIRRDSERMSAPPTPAASKKNEVDLPPPIPPPISSLDEDLANLIPGYTLLKKLGQGAMGVVYKAKKDNLEKEVAIKILPPDVTKDDQRMERFIREAKALGKLQHPNIIKAIDLGKAKGYAYYAMEYVAGQTLNKLLKNVLVIPEKKALEMVRDVASAMAHAWKNGIIHRDIKPENIMLSQEGIVKLCDLGLAKVVDRKKNQVQLTMEGTTVGTPLYMSPEQAKGEDIDIRTDIYALGVTLFEMVTGKPPYFHNSPIIVMQMHLMEKVPFASDLNPDVSEFTSNLIYHMMQKELDERISSPEEVFEIIEDILSGKPYPEEEPEKSPIKKGFDELRKKFLKKKIRKRL